jgi:FkbH-like protein
MPDGPRRGVLLSDFNIANLGGYLDGDPDEPQVEAHVAPYGQAVPILANPDHDVWRPLPAFAVVWTRPGNVIESYGRMLRDEEADPHALLAEVGEYAGLLNALAGRVPTVFVPTWTASEAGGGLGMLDMRPGPGRAHMLARMNLALADACAAQANIYILDAGRWLQGAGRAAFSPTLWYMAKVPFGPEVFRQAARSIKAALRGLAGGARKLVILDLDDTLWGGIVGEVGWNGLRLGGHDPVGEAYADFQAALKGLRRRGILLAIASKNEENVALEAIRRHPDMVLREEDFVDWRINWTDKAQNVDDLITGLNLGRSAAVFIDDHPAERARVREALPEVLVPEWPQDPALFRSALLNLRCFDVPSLSREDSVRTEMYSAERRREALRTRIGSVQDWLQSLGMRVTVEPLNSGNLTRTAQLLNKTNQMNLATRRLTEPELTAWAARPGNALLTFRVADKFGDAGLTGILGLEVADGALLVADFVLSCRVMGRRVEETMLAIAVEHARVLGLPRIFAVHRPTERNVPCLRFFEQSGLKREGVGIFFWPTADPYPVPVTIALERLP